MNKTPKADWETVVMPAKPTKRAKGSVREGEAGKKAKATQHAGGKSVSEKSQTTRTSKNLFEKCSQQEYFVDVRKDRRMSKNGVEFLIGWRDFSNIKYDTWEPNPACAIKKIAKKKLKTVFIFF